ncbi:MAG: hypothetical protein COS34_07835, partial [Lysobacterales bacterium CG02_land_8_20_14_3_00_62_12]
MALSAALPAWASIALTLNFTGPATYTPGAAGASSYVLTLGNTGTTTETGATVTTTFPATATVTWACVAAGASTACKTPTSGSGNLSARDPGNIAQNGTLTYTFSVSFPSSLATSPLNVNAQISSSDTTPVVTSGTVSSTRVAQSDLSAAFVSPPTS